MSNGIEVKGRAFRGVLSTRSAKLTSLIAVPTPSTMYVLFSYECGTVDSTVLSNVTANPLVNTIPFGLVNVGLPTISVSILTDNDSASTIFITPNRAGTAES